MGRLGYPLYGDDFATDIETVEKLLAVIKKGKATENDLVEFSDVAKRIVDYALADKD